MNPTPSNTRAPPTTGYDSLTNIVPLSGKTASSIATYGRRDVPKFAIHVRDVVRAYVYMDSVFFAADVQSQLANPANLEDERTLYEKRVLERQGERRKLRPCVVTEIFRRKGRKTRYLLCPMAGLHDEKGDGERGKRKGDGERQSFEDLEEPVSLLVRPVQSINNNQPFGDYVAYRFKPEWNNGPQYLFPVEVSRNEAFITDHRLPQFMEMQSFKQLREDIKEVSNVWKKWRNAEHVTVECNEDVPVFKSEWDTQGWENISPKQWKAYSKRRRGGGTQDPFPLSTSIGTGRKRNDYLILTTNTKPTKEANDAAPFKAPADGTTLSNASKEGGAPLPALDALPVQGGHTPSRTPSSPHQADLPAPNSTTNGSKEMPDGHPAVPFHLVTAPSPRMTPLRTEKVIIPTEMPFQSPHGEPSHSDDFIQGRKAAGAKGDSLLELEGPSDMDISSTSNASSSRSKYTAKRHSSRSSERPNGSSVVRQYLATPIVEDETSHSPQHLLKDCVKSLHHDPNFLSESDRITVDKHTLPKVSKGVLVMVGGNPSISSWKQATVSRGVKRARSSEDELSAADIHPKRQRKN